MSDDQSGTYTLIQNQTCDMTGANADRMSVFVRDQLCANTNSHTITAATGSNTAGELVVLAFSRMTKTGSAAVRSSGKAEGATGVAPAAALDQAALTTNPTIFFCGSADTTTTAPTSWTERQDASQSSPTTACEGATRDTGFTGTTITSAATQTGAWGCIVLELDGLQEGGGDDTVSTSDSVSTTGTVYDRTASDTVSTSDSLAQTCACERTASDTLTLSDTHDQEFTQGAQTYDREASDTIDLTDSATAGTDHSEEAADTIDLSDSVEQVASYERTGSDTIDLSDSVTQEFTSGAFDQTHADTVELTDATTAGLETARTPSDTIDVTDGVDRVGTIYDRASYLVLEIVTTL